MTWVRSQTVQHTPPLLCNVCTRKQNSSKWEMYIHTVFLFPNFRDQMHLLSTINTLGFKPQWESVWPDSFDRDNQDWWTNRWAAARCGQISRWTTARKPLRKLQSLGRTSAHTNTSWLWDGAYNTYYIYILYYVSCNYPHAPPTSSTKLYFWAPSSKRMAVVWGRGWAVTFNSGV